MIIKENTAYRTKNGYVVKTTKAANAGDNTWVSTNLKWPDVSLSSATSIRLFYNENGRSNHNSNREADLIEELKIEDYPELYL